ncbi:hypothetical protein EVAR_40012_1 [Eumeta japonica]|uniref:Uncharacterized protein n=1 Tax=Eumeta variegata TaxID=151549 RepID=A0A4C1YRU4_EUMVA|nr:hypothetical protein EVAR_40012_1 [Eumeta japonica]
MTFPSCFEKQALTLTSNFPRDRYNNLIKRSEKYKMSLVKELAIVAAIGARVDKPICTYLDFTYELKTGLSLPGKKTLMEHQSGSPAELKNVWHSGTAVLFTYSSDFGAARLDPCELRKVVPYTYTLSERSAELHERRWVSQIAVEVLSYHVQMVEEVRCVIFDIENRKQLFPNEIKMCKIIGRLADPYRNATESCKKAFVNSTAVCRRGHTRLHHVYKRSLMQLYKQVHIEYWLAYSSAVA